MKKVELTQGKYAYVDNNDYKWLIKGKWYSHKQRHDQTKEHYYARGWLLGLNKPIMMHRAIMEKLLGRSLEKNEQIDHIDGNGLNNKKSNLRVVNRRENSQNRHEFKTSEYPGVSWNKRDKVWVAKIQVGKKHKNLGSFNNEMNAYSTYLKACKVLETGTVKEINELLAPTKKSSKYPGVCWRPRNRKWEAYCYSNKKQIFIGSFKTEEEAHKSREKYIKNETIS
jgi:hypothetical protein